MLRLVPHDCTRVLDVGCGDGSFARRLASRCAEVVAVDADELQVEQARRTCAGLTNVTVLHGNVLSADLGSRCFDVVTALASLHHLPFEPGVASLRELLRPGGRLIVLGVWTDNVTWSDVVLTTLRA